MKNILTFLFVTWHTYAYGSVILGMGERTYIWTDLLLIIFLTYSLYFVRSIMSYPAMTQAFFYMSTHSHTPLSVESLTIQSLEFFLHALYTLSVVSCPIQR